MLRILSWNVNGRHLWGQLADGEVHVALLQEAPVPPSPWDGKVVPHPDVLGERLRREGVRVAGPAEGAVAAADVFVDGERITILSIYATWEGGRPGPIYADASAHRLLSDLAGIVNDARAAFGVSSITD